MTLKFSRPDDAAEVRRRAVWTVPTPLAVLGTIDGDEPHLMNVSWFTVVSADPVSVVVSVESTSRTRGLLATDPRVALALVDAQTPELGRAFVKPALRYERTGDGEFLQGHAISRAANAAPFPSAAVVVFAGHADELRTVGEYVVFLCHVSEIGSDERLVTGPPSQRSLRALSVQDTRMNYGR